MAPPPQVEKERELELQEKLDEQRRALEGEHEAALQGKDGAVVREDVGGPPSGPICQGHRGGLPLAPPPASASPAVGSCRAAVCRLLDGPCGASL